MDAGDIHLADLNEERRRPVLVLSNRRFHHLSGRAVVAPGIATDPDEVPFPWRIPVDDVVYAVDLVRSIPIERLLDRTDRAPAPAVEAAWRALRAIT